MTPCTQSLRDFAENLQEENTDLKNELAIQRSETEYFKNQLDNIRRSQATKVFPMQLGISTALVLSPIYEQVIPVLFRELRWPRSNIRG